MDGDLEPLESIERHWEDPDPWAYDSTPDDEVRAARLLTHLPERRYARTLDIGCGNGFVTLRLPGDEVIGTDISERAVGWARERAAAREDAGRFRFEAASIFDLAGRGLGRFDLVVVTGVLYEPYIGRAFSLVRLIVDDLLADGGVLASVHIDDWFPHRFPYTTLRISIDRYREYHHRLEVQQR